MDKFERTLRVLIVDDHLDAADTLARLLRLRNCEVCIAHDGTRALELARDFHPLVFLLDLGLPGLDGYELARILHADPQFALSHMIAISGYAQESDFARSRDAGFDHHFAKPVNFAELCNVIRSAVSGRQ